MQEECPSLGGRVSVLRLATRAVHGSMIELAHESGFKGR